MRINRIDVLSIASLLFLSAFFLFFRLHYSDIQTWDESTNALVVYETLHASDKSVLLFEGRPFFEKPPLWYYATMGVVAIFGFTEISLRSVSALSGTGIVLLLYFVGSRLVSRRTGFLASVSVFTVTQLFFFNPGGLFSTHTLRSADSDALQLLFILTSTLSFSLANGKKRWMYGGFIFSALAIITKGPLGFLPVIVWGIMNLSVAKRSQLSRKTVFAAFVLFCGIVFSWHAYMYFKFGGSFIETYFGYHLFARASSILENHAEPWWFYLKVLASPQVFPGFLLCITAFLIVLKTRPRNTCPVINASLISVILVFFFITLSKTKLAWYILPLYPFIALIIGFGWDKLINSAGRKISPAKIVVIGGGILLVAAIGYNGTLMLREKRGIQNTFFREARIRCPEGLFSLTDSTDRGERYYFIRHKILVKEDAAQRDSPPACIVHRGDFKDSNDDSTIPGATE